MKHTPGPWHNSENYVYSRSNIAGVPDLITRCPDVKGMPYIANARRIAACVNGCEGIANPAAVPKLLEELEKVLATATGDDALWWMSLPERGGIDVDAIEQVIANVSIVEATGAMGGEVSNAQMHDHELTPDEIAQSYEAKGE